MRVPGIVERRIREAGSVERAADDRKGRAGDFRGAHFAANVAMRRVRGSFRDPPHGLGEHDIAITYRVDDDLGAGSSGSRRRNENVAVTLMFRERGARCELGRCRR